MINWKHCILPFLCFCLAGQEPVAVTIQAKTEPQTEATAHKLMNAIQGDDVALMLSAMSGHTEIWVPFSRDEKRSLSPLEASAYFGSIKCFENLAAPQKIKEDSPTKKARLLSLCVMPLPPDKAQREKAKDLRQEANGNPAAAKTYVELREAFRDRLQQMAVKKCSILKQLLSLGCDPNLADETGLRPLHHAAYWGNASACELLINSGADLNAFSAVQEVKWPHEPMHDEDPSRWIHGNAAAAAQVSWQGKNPLQLALQCRYTLTTDPHFLFLHPISPKMHLDTVKALLKHRPDLQLKDESGMTSLMYAAFYLCTNDLHEEMTGEGRQVDVPFGDPKEALQIINTLLKQGSNPKAVANRGYTALAFATRAAFTEGIQRLLSVTPREITWTPEAATPITFDPVHQAMACAIAVKHSETMVKLLAQQGVDPLKPLASGVFPAQGQDYEENPWEQSPIESPDLLTLAEKQGPLMVEALSTHVKDPARLATARQRSLDRAIQQGTTWELIQLAELTGSAQIKQKALSFLLRDCITEMSFKRDTPPGGGTPRDISYIQNLLDQGARPLPNAHFPWSRLMDNYFNDQIADGKPVARAILGSIQDWKQVHEWDHVLKFLPLTSNKDIETLHLLLQFRYPFRDLADKKGLLERARGWNWSKSDIQQLRTLLKGEPTSKGKPAKRKHK